MKTFVILFLLAVTLFGCHTGEQKSVKKDTPEKDSVKNKVIKELGDIYLTSPFDTTGLLTILFDPDTVINNVALWVPDADASFNMNVSEDGYCHTNIDTILKVPNGKGTNYLVIFSTFEYGSKGEKENYHACEVNYGMTELVPQTLVSGETVNLPDSTMKNAHYTMRYRVTRFLRNFTTAGSWGDGGKISLANFGDYVLHISWEYTGTGLFHNLEEYYSTDDGKLLFSYASSYTNENSFFYEGGGDEKVIKRTLEIIPHKINDWSELKLHCRLTRFDTTQHKLPDSVYTEYYEMNEQGNAYEKEVK